MVRLIGRVDGGGEGKEGEDREDEESKGFDPGRGWHSSRCRRGEICTECEETIGQKARILQKASGERRVIESIVDIYITSVDPKDITNDLWRF